MNPADLVAGKVYSYNDIYHTGKIIAIEFVEVWRSQDRPDVDIYQFIADRTFCHCSMLYRDVQELVEDDGRFKRQGACYVETGEAVERKNFLHVDFVGRGKVLGTIITYEGREINVAESGEGSAKWAGDMGYRVIKEDGPIITYGFQGPDPFQVRMWGGF